MGKERVHLNPGNTEWLWDLGLVSSRTMMLNEVALPKQIPDVILDPPGFLAPG